MTAAVERGRVDPGGLPKPAFAMRRPRLEDRLDEAFGKRLTTVVAGAGFGKSTLLALWAADVECAWYTLTAEDADLPTLARGLAEAVRQRVALPLEPEPSSTLGEDEGARADAFAGALCQALEEHLSHDLLLVLDDVHELGESARSARLIESICRQAPPGLHVVLASRAEPPFPIQRLRGQGAVLELDGAALAFSHDETAEALEEALGASAKPLAGPIHEATAGWPAAVRLAVEALRAAPQEVWSEIVERLPQPGGPVYAYLAEEVLGSEPEDVRRLLHHVALLGPCSPELAVELGLAADAVTIARLVRRGLVVEEPGDRLRLHPLVRDFALREWPLTPAEQRELHLTAAGWLERQGEIDAACRSLLAAGDADGLARLLVEHGGALLAGGLAGTVVTASAALPAALRSPAVEQVTGEAHTIRGEYDSALECFERAAGDARPLPSGLAWRLVTMHQLRDDLDSAKDVWARSEVGSPASRDDALLLAWMASVHYRFGENAAADTKARRALEIATACADDEALAAAHTAIALVTHTAGDTEATERSMRRALEHAERAGNVQQVTRIHNNRGSMLLEHAAYEPAIEELEQAMRLAEVAGYVSLLALAIMNRGLANWCLGRLDEARVDYEAAAAIYERTGSLQRSYALIGLGDVYRERGELALARSTYENGLTVAERSGDLQGVVPGLYQLAKVLVDDDPERATALAERAVAYGWPDTAWALNAAGWVALARGDLVRARQAGDQAAEAARQRLDSFGLAEALELQALAADEPARERVRLEQALAIWEELGNPVHQSVVELALTRLAPEARAGSQVAADRAERRLRSLGVNVDPAGPAGLLRFVARRSSSPVAIQTLGGFRVLRDGQPVALADWGSKKARDLLKILVARRGRPIAREQLMGLLWPGEEPAKLSGRLSVAISVLRSVLDPDKRFEPDRFVDGDGASVWLALANVEVDVEDFLLELASVPELRRAGRLGDALEGLEHAEATYVGEFLEGDVYDDWAVGLREEARMAYVGAARALATHALESDEHDAAVRYLLRILERDAHDEQAHLDLMRTLAAAGRHGEARRRYHAYAAAMDEINVEPAPFPGESG